VAIDTVEPQCTLEPATAGDVIFGVQATLVVERCLAETLLPAWSGRIRPSVS
jgi:hypothetical protein